MIRLKPNHSSYRWCHRMIRYAISTWSRLCFAMLSTAALAFALLDNPIRAEDTSDEQLFESKIRPLLVQSCFRCHGGEKISGGLRVDSREALLKGGDSGSALILNDPDASRILKALRRNDDEVAAMPPEKPLEQASINAFADWIRRGAPWPATTPQFAASSADQHWAFQPLQPQSFDGPAAEAVDHFIDREFVKRKVAPSPTADRKTLIRRATYDLIGLPPTQAEIDAFVSDPSPDAYRNLIESLLAKPQYGEQWGRHWLDVVRYADTAGENSDHPVPHAWRYRNWVIDAFNRDLPYNEFLQHQIAGDLLATNLIRDVQPADLEPLLPQYADRLVATGYLAIARRFGHDIDKDMHLTHEDVIDTLGKSILGLTLGCARCHSHKYDPITHEDYYALYGILDSTRFSFPGCEPKQQPRDLVSLLPAAEFDRKVRPFQEELAKIDAALKQVQEEIQATSALKSDPDRERMVASGEFNDGGSQEWTSQDLTQSIAVEAGQLLRLSILPRANYGADTTIIEWEIRESGGEQRIWSLTRDVVDDFLAGNPRSDRLGHTAVWCFLDSRKGIQLLQEPVRDLSGKPGLAAWRNGDNPAVFVNATDQPVSAWTTLPGKTVFAHPAMDGPVAVGWVSPIGGKVDVRLRIADGHAGGGDGVGWSLEHFQGRFDEVMKQQVAKREQLAKLNQRKKELLAGQPQAPVAYAVAEGAVKHARIHERGDPEKPGREVPRRWLTLFGGEPVADGSGSGRLQLAQWLTEPKNPLTARVMVNRIWQYHFGRGLVKTPNDFGTRGQSPTHPELLDWLAKEFIRSGWSIKQMHRVIMLSQAYQRSSARQASAGQGRGIPAEDNPSTPPAPLARVGSDEADPLAPGDYYASFDRRRLTAEELRDALLMVSGQLDSTAGGPHNFPPEATWSFSQHNPFSAMVETNRRSVYMMILRNRRHPFLALFDGADPNASTGQRQVTTVPTQALYFMNDPFVHGCAERAAAAAIESGPSDGAVDRLYRRCFGRAASDEEQQQAREFLAVYTSELESIPAEQRPLQALAAWARVLLASNEFLYVE